jgi:hypothetical protein
LLSSSKTLDKGPKIFFNATLLSSYKLSGSNVILRWVSSETQSMQVARLHVLLKFKTLKIQYHQFYFIMVYLMMLSVTYAVDCQLVGHRRKSSWPILRYCHSRCQGLRKTIKKLIEDSLSWGQNRNLLSPEY